MIISNVRPGTAPMSDIGATPICDVSWNGRIYSGVMMMTGSNGWYVSLKDLHRKMAVEGST